MNKIKVLHININYTTTKLHQNMISHLEKNGVVNYVFSPTYDKEKSIAKSSNNVNICQCFKKKDRYFYRIKQKKILENIKLNVNIRQFDIIHAYTVMSDGNVARNLSKEYGVPYVVAVRDTDINTFFRYRKDLIKLGKKIMLDAEKVFFLSKSYRDNILNNFCDLTERENLSKKAIIVPNGLDDFWILNKFKKEKLHDPLRLLYVGKICKRKNVITTIKVLDYLNNLGVNSILTIIGSNEDNKIYKKIVENKRVIIKEFMKKEELINYYRQSDIFVMPSITETFGLTYAEALSQSTPIIYSKNQGFDGYYEDGIIGYSVNSKNVKEIAEAIIKIVNNYDFISSNCTINIDAFNWETIVKIYLKIYTQIMNKNN